MVGVTSSQSWQYKPITSDHKIQRRQVCITKSDVYHATVWHSLQGEQDSMDDLIDAISGRSKLANWLQVRIHQ